MVQDNEREVMRVRDDLLALGGVIRKLQAELEPLAAAEQHRPLTIGELHQLRAMRQERQRLRQELDGLVREFWRVRYAPNAS